MSTQSVAVEGLLADARSMHSQAVERLHQGDIRYAAEKGVVRHQAGRRCYDPGSDRCAAS